jgi:membrane-associated phospholipid phosphatase
MIKWQLFDKRFLVRHIWAIGFMLFFILGSLLLVISHKHGELNLWFNKHYSISIGRFFSYYTNLGQEWLLVPISIIILFFNRSQTFTLRLFATFILNSLLTAGLKYMVFDMKRPKVVLEKFNLIFTEGVNMHSYNSFPSGHTSAAFALAMAISFWYQKKYISLMAIAMAIGVGISRIYLQQHFLEDVIGGAIIGFISATIATSLTWQSKHK